MKLGAVFPQNEIGTDPAVIRQFCTTVESLGFDFIAVYDHVLGVDPDRPNWTGVYSNKDQFHEIFVLFGYMAAITEKLGLVSRVLVLPQRETALVAKQAAEIDILSGGRLRLGLGVGWNAVELESLGFQFKQRGRRFEEQVVVMKQLWSRDTIDFSGEFHRIDRAGIAPRPASGSIPLWIGGRADAVLRRAARLADGWMPQQLTEEDIDPTLQKIRGFLEENHRDPATFGIDASVKITNVDHAIDLAHAWERRDIGFLTVNTLGTGLSTPKDHLDVLRDFKSAWTPSK